MSNILELNNITKAYGKGEAAFVVLNDISLNVKEGEIVALVGPSGCGKSTLLNVAGLIDTKDEGEILIDGENVGNFSDSKYTKIRRDKIGFVYQFHHLLPEFTALENIIMPDIIAGKKRSDVEKAAHELLELVGMPDKANSLPQELSGGEQQRVAILRAIAHSPKLILADEPTGNLDPHTSEVVFDLMIDIIKKQNLAALIVTHNHDLAKRMDRIIQFEEL